MEKLASAVAEARRVLAHATALPADFASMDDTALLSLHSAIIETRRSLDVYSSLAAGEIARRSHRDFGHSGLAQTAGFPTAEKLIQATTGSTRAEATKLVKVGSLAVEPEPGWHAPLVVALTSGAVSVDAVDAVRRGLGEPDGVISASQLESASVQLLGEARALDADDLFRAARALREELDSAAVARREKEQRDQRYFRAYTRPDGMVGGSFLLDSEDGGTLLAAIDTVLSPRRGGPRFVDAREKARADEVLTDERSNDQLVADTVMDMIRLAINADPGTIFGSRTPAVRVHVTEEVLVSRQGHGAWEDQATTASIETIERQLCTGGQVGVKFDDDGQCVNVGRDQRLFTARQRIGLAARDGGCIAPGCSRPPSQTEAHHINHWHRDQGRTDISDGVLLCRFHHMLFHNNHWEIRRHDGRYLLIPPVDVDPLQEPIPLRSKSRLPERQRQDRSTVHAELQLQ